MAGAASPTAMAAAAATDPLGQAAHVHSLQNANVVMFDSHTNFHFCESNT